VLARISLRGVVVGHILESVNALREKRQSRGSQLVWHQSWLLNFCLGFLLRYFKECSFCCIIWAHIDYLLIARLGCIPARQCWSVLGLVVRLDWSCHRWHISAGVVGVTPHLKISVLLLYDSWLSLIILKPLRMTLIWEEGIRNTHWMELRVQVGRLKLACVPILLQVAVVWTKLLLKRLPLELPAGKILNGNWHGFLLVN